MAVQASDTINGIQEAILSEVQKQIDAEILVIIDQAKATIEKKVREAVAKTSLQAQNFVDFERLDTNLVIKVRIG